MSSTAQGAAKSNVAVALHYETGEGLPVVVAKGHGYIAEKIIESALQAGVPIEHDPILAGSLSNLEIDQAIPPELYKAVAQVIAFLLRRKRG